MDIAHDPDGSSSLPDEGSEVDTRVELFGLQEVRRRRHEVSAAEFLGIHDIVPFQEMAGHVLIAALLGGIEIRAPYAVDDQGAY